MIVYNLLVIHLIKFNYLGNNNLDNTTDLSLFLFEIGLVSLLAKNKEKFIKN